MKIKLRVAEIWECCSLVSGPYHHHDVQLANVVEGDRLRLPIPVPFRDQAAPILRHILWQRQGTSKVKKWIWHPNSEWLWDTIFSQAVGLCARAWSDRRRPRARLPRPWPEETSHFKRQLAEASRTSHARAGKLQISPGNSVWKRSKQPIKTCMCTVMSYSNENLTFKWELPACLFPFTKKEEQQREDGWRIGHSHLNRHHCSSLTF